MDNAGKWLKSIVYCICILELFYHLVQNPYYQKYIRFFGGLVLLMTVIAPVLQFTKKGDFLEANLWKEEVRSQIEEMEQATRSLGDLQSDQIKNAIENRLKDQIGEMAERYGLDVREISIELGDNLQEINTIEVCLKETEETPDWFLEMLQKWYQIPIERIKIRYVEEDE